MARSSETVHACVVRQIRRLANQKGLALSYVPDHAGLSRSHFWAVLSGKRSPTLGWLVQVAEALGVDVRELISG